MKQIFSYKLLRQAVLFGGILAGITNLCAADMTQATDDLAPLLDEHIEQQIDINAKNPVNILVDQEKQKQTHHNCIHNADENKLAIVFDIHGVLLKEDLAGHVKKTVAKILEQMNQPVQRGLKDSRPYQILCEILTEHCPVCENSLCQEQENTAHLPHCVYEMFAGRITPDELHERIKAILPLAEFSSQKEQLLVTALVQAVFSRTELMDSIIVLNEGYMLLQIFAREIQSEQKRNVYIFSNAPYQWIDYERVAFPAVFELLGNADIMTSGNAGALKPSQTAYDFVMNKHNLKPENVVLIDDTQANVDGAKELGLNAVFFDYTKIDQTIDELVCLGVMNDDQRDTLLAALEGHRTPDLHIERTFF